MGVIFDPFRGEMFSASLGGGAFCNEDAISVSQSEKSIGQALVAFGTGRKNDMALTMLGGAGAVAEICRSVRSFGSAALHLSWVACGRLTVRGACTVHTNGAHSAPQMREVCLFNAVLRGASASLCSFLHVSLCAGLLGVGFVLLGHHGRVAACDRGRRVRFRRTGGVFFSAHTGHAGQHRGGRHP